MEQKPTSSEPVDVTKSNRLRKIKNSIQSFFKKRPPKKRLAIVGGVAGGVLIIGVVGAFTLIKPSVEPKPVPEVTSTYVPPPEPIYSPLTGIETTEELANRPVTAIMIENSVDARPQSGLDTAGVVFEAIAEGGITRFMALYQESRPDNIGPIRSARPYYVRWAAGFDAQYVHVGGSPEGLALVRSLGLKDLDQMRFGDALANRVSNRYAPHNMYTDFNRIDAISKEQNYSSSDFNPFERKDDEPSDADSPATAASVVMDISGANYNTSYSYDVKTNRYTRVMAGLPHNDQESGKQIAPKVLVALEMSYSIHPNHIHSVYNNVGNGVAYVFQDGKVVKGKWKKSSDKASLQLLDSKDKPIPLNAGQTWITAIQSGRVSYDP